MVYFSGFIFISFLAVFGILAVLFLTLLVLFKSQTKSFMKSYECGVESVTPPWSGISIPFFKIGLVFVLFDLEVVLLFQFIFLYSFGLVWFGFLFIFVMFMYGTLILEWVNNSLSWGL